MITPNTPIIRYDMALIGGRYGKWERTQVWRGDLRTFIINHMVDGRLCKDCQGTGQTEGIGGRMSPCVECFEFGVEFGYDDGGDYAGDYDWLSKERFEKIVGSLETYGIYSEAIGTSHKWQIEVATR